MRPNPLLIAAIGALLATSATAQGTRLLRQPTVRAKHVAFGYANDLWIVARAGGDARRLTSHPGSESQPCFSPDGKLVAFTGQYDGNTDVYVVPIEGGSPRRLTWHPLPDTVCGWTPDGNSVVFTSGRDSAPTPHGKFYTVPVAGGFPARLLDLRAWEGKLSADGRKLAYQEIAPSDQEWRNYRGGQAQPIWILDLADHSLEKAPWVDEQQWHPVWLDKAVYYLSDRDYAMNVYRYLPGSGKSEQLTHYRDFDCKELEAGGGVLVYENGCYLHLLDPAVGQARQLEIHVRGDLPWARPHWEDVGGLIRTGALSPTGKRALFEARGEIFSVPAEKGSIRNLTHSSGAADRTPSWSPDGRYVAWFSDASGEYRLLLGDQDGLEPPREIELPEPTFYYTPAWSPDSKRLAFTDEGLNLWVVEIESGKVARVDGDTYAHPVRTLDPVWSPDSRWLAYAKRLPSQYHAVYVHDVDAGATHQLTDGMSDAFTPAWDASGKYLYFLASTDYAMTTGWLDMTSYDRPVRHALYVAVLSKETPSPFLPESDEETVKEEKPAAEAAAADAKAKPPGDEALKVVIDLEGLDQRILALDVPAGSFLGLTAGKAGVLFFTEAPGAATIFGPPTVALNRYELEKNESKPFLSGIGGFTLSADGEKMLVSVGGSWRIVGTAAAPAPGSGSIDVRGMRMHVDPRAEWEQIFHEAWRLQRDYLYVPNVHGADWDAIYRMYQPWVAHVGHRADLTYLLDILGGEVSVGHSFTFGGDTPDVERVNVGQLGADFAVEQGRYRIKRILTGENWNPDLRAPLSAPGVDVREGDYLLEVDGVAVAPPTNLHAYFEGSAGRQVVLKVNDRPGTVGAREVTVVPVGNEVALRQRAWIEGNRRKVDEMSDGKLAYVWLPNTGQGGYTQFNRYYFAQQDRQGAVIDERFNGGGSAADYMVDVMARRILGFFNNPVGERAPFHTPQAGIWGPKVMLINDAAGSGGDLLPYMFRAMGIGPLIGTTTWGGLVGIWDTPAFVDGGAITAPRGGFYDLNGEWRVENEGVAADIRVEMTPKLVLAGRDPQLERAVHECLLLLAANPVHILPEPEAPVRAKRPGR
ncbi:MAG TPA: PDZ domain-containing protein [Planctomycetota bacterium]